MSATSPTRSVETSAPALSEQQFASTFGHAAIGMALVAPDGRFLKVNRALCDMLGYTPVDLLARTYQSLTHPSDQDDHGNVHKLLAGEIASFQMEKRYLHALGHAVWVLLSVSSVRDANGQPLHQIAQLQDITAHKAREAEIARLNRLYAALSHVNKAIVRLPTPQALFPRVCETLVTQGGFCMAWIAWSSSPGLPLHSAACWGDPVGDPAVHMPAQVAYTTGQPAFCNDISHDPGMQLWRDHAQHNGWRACAAFPIFLQGSVRGTLSVYAKEPGILQDKELALLSEAAVDVSFALDNFARSAARREAEDRHVASEARLATAQALAHMGSWELDLATMTGTYSAEMFRLFYRDPALGAPAFAEFSELVHPQDRHLVAQALAHTEQADAPYGLEYRTNPSLGPVRHLSATIHVIRDGAGHPVCTRGTTLDVTERRRAQAETEQALRRLTQAQRISQMGDWEWDIATQAITWSAQVYAIFGRDPALGPPISLDDTAAMYDAASNALLREKVGLCIATGEPQEYELVAIRPDGQRIHVQARAQPRKDAQGKVVGLYGTVQDISARKQAAEQLRQSEENLAITLQSIGDAVITTDTETRVTRMNPTAERLLAWPEKEALGRPLDEVFQIVHTQTRELAPNPAQRVMASGQVVALSNHTSLLARDGAEYQIFDSAAPIRNRDGHITGVVLVFSDVTESYRVREALASTSALLERTGELAKVGGWELDLATMQPYWTSVTCRLHEVDPPVAPPLDTIWSFYPLVSRATMQAAVQSCITRGEPFDLELRMTTAKGRPVWVRAQGMAVVEGGKPTKLVGAFHDITERKHAQSALQTSLQEKEALLKEVHHRVKNNLQVINSLLRLEAGRSTAPDTQTVLRDMQARIHAMALLHESLYRDGTAAAVDLGAYLRQLVNQSFHTQVPSGGTAIQLAFALDSVLVGMDQATPCGLLVNELVSNCFKHAFPAGRGGTVRVELLAPVGTRSARVTVSDNGIGLPADFEQRRGQSLGLQLVSGLAGQLKGTLQIGPGPTFSVGFALDD